jgi:hypothetical protein
VKDSDQVLQTVIDYSCDENKNWKKLKRAWEGKWLNCTLLFNLLKVLLFWMIQDNLYTGLDQNQIRVEPLTNGLQPLRPPFDRGRGLVPHCVGTVELHTLG